MATKKKTEKKTEPETKPVDEKEALQETKEEKTALEKMGPPPMGFDGFTEDDLVIPRVSITQKAGDASDKGFTIGFLRSNISEEEWENIRATPMLYTKGMVMFEKPYQAGAKPICKSNDALKPSDQIENPPSDVCHRIVRRRLVPVCPNAIWGKDEKTGKGVPPACNLCYNVVFKRDDNNMGFFMSFRSTAIKAWKNFLSMMWGQRKNLFAMSVLIGTEDMTNSFGTFKVPRLSDFEAHDTADEEELVDVYKGFQAMDLDASFDDERNQGDDGENLDEGDASFDTDSLDNEKF